MFEDLVSMHKRYDVYEDEGGGDKQEKAEKEGFSPEIKKKTLTAILLILLIGNMQVGNLCIVLPNFIEGSTEWD